MAPELKIFRGEPQRNQALFPSDSILELQSEAAPVHRGAARVRFREMEPFSSPGLWPKTRCVGRIWHGDTSSRPPRKTKRALHQLKPVNKHQTNGVTL